MPIPPNLLSQASNTGVSPRTRTALRKLMTDEFTLNPAFQDPAEQGFSLTGTEPVGGAAAMGGALLGGEAEGTAAAPAERAVPKRPGFYDTTGGQMVKDLLEKRKNVLVFTRFVEESMYLASSLGAAMVSAETPKREREQILGKFKTGEIRVVCNVGVLTTGFDHPELETVVLARPTMSLALYYQMIGRCIRPHPGKEWAEVHDLCDNYSLFGPIEKLRLVDGQNGKWYITGAGGKQLTNVYYGEKYVPNRQKHLSFGGRGK